MFELPINQEGPHFGFTTELDQVSYGCTFRWNDRDDCWRLDFADGNGDPIISGRKVLTSQSLLASSSDPRLPKGVLVAIDSGGQNLNPGFEDLGRRVQLVYFSADELAALAAAAVTG